jgi:hypothetical protein
LDKWPPKLEFINGCGSPYQSFRKRPNGISHGAVMQQNIYSAMLGYTKFHLDQLENRVQGRLCGRVQNLRLCFHDTGIVLRGLAHTYHDKQLAQHVVMTETDLPILANDIEVR